MPVQKFSGAVFLNFLFSLAKMEQLLDSLIFAAGALRQLDSQKDIPASAEAFKRTAAKFQITLSGTVGVEVVDDLCQEMLPRVHDFQDAVRSHIIDLQEVIFKIVGEYLAKVHKALSEFIEKIKNAEPAVQALGVLEETIDQAHSLPLSLKAYSDKEISKICLHLNSALMDLQSEEESPQIHYINQISEHIKKLLSHFGNQLNSDSAISVEDIENAKNLCKVVDDLACLFMSIDDDEEEEEDFDRDELNKHVELLNKFEGIPQLVINFI